MTASTLFEAVEPTMLWKQLLSCVFDAINDGSQLEVRRAIPSDLSLCNLALLGDTIDAFPSSRASGA